MTNIKEIIDFFQDILLRNDLYLVVFIAILYLIIVFYSFKYIWGYHYKYLYAIQNDLQCTRKDILEKDTTRFASYNIIENSSNFYNSVIGFTSCILLLLILIVFANFKNGIRGLLNFKVIISIIFLLFTILICKKSKNLVIQSNLENDKEIYDGKKAIIGLLLQIHSSNQNVNDDEVYQKLKNNIIIQIKIQEQISTSSAELKYDDLLNNNYIKLTDYLRFSNTSPDYELLIGLICKDNNSKLNELLAKYNLTNDTSLITNTLCNTATNQNKILNNYLKQKLGNTMLNEDNPDFIEIKNNLCTTCIFNTDNNKNIDLQGTLDIIKLLGNLNNYNKIDFVKKIINSWISIIIIGVGIIFFFIYHLLYKIINTTLLIGSLLILIILLILMRIII